MQFIDKTYIIQYSIIAVILLNVFNHGTAAGSIFYNLYLTFFCLFVSFQKVSVLTWFVYRGDNSFTEKSNDCYFNLIF